MQVFVAKYLHVEVFFHIFRFAISQIPLKYPFIVQILTGLIKVDDFDDPRF